MGDEQKSSFAGRTSALLPDWVSSDLIDQTKSVWRSEYGEDLTTADAVGLLQNMVSVFELLDEDEIENNEEDASYGE